jgi:hypothetical protein
VHVGHGGCRGDPDDGDARHLPGLLRLGGERRDEEAEGEQEREAPARHGHGLRGGPARLPPGPRGLLSDLPAPLRREGLQAALAADLPAEPPEGHRMRVLSSWAHGPRLGQAFRRVKLKRSGNNPGGLQN